jgi:ATPase subunit of ABC transporter with duplicated ATPase domains
MQKIIVKKINFILDAGETLFEDVSFTLQKGDMVGVIGKNGSGKTTLLKILLGKIKQSDGEFEISKNIYYVPQQKETDNEKLKNLSGGEFIRYHINQARIIKPDVLLLDEPTNHLDEKGRLELQQFIDSYKGILIFVSHDVDFLKVNAKIIFNIWDKTLEVFSGTYEEWEESFQKYLEGIERQKSALKKEEKKLKEAQRIETERHQRVNQKNRNLRHDNSMGGLEKGFFKDSSQFSHGRIKAQIERLQETNKNNQNKLELPKDLNVSFLFPSTDNKRSLLIKIVNGNLKIMGRELINSYNFEIYYGDKVLLKGDNGTGKSLFINSLINQDVNAEEKFFKQDLKIVYLDQFYNIVDRDKTILENVSENAPDIQTARKILSIYGFPDAHIVNQKAKNLSGGEMCRLALAKISVQPLDLIMLDEPTNNIDIATKNILEKSINKFTGGLLVISHDKNFVTGINVHQEITISNLSLK